VKTIPERAGVLAALKPRIITLGSREFSAAGVMPGIPSARTNTAWHTANDPVAYPFALREAAVVTKLGWVNGSAAGGGVDLGIYDLSWNRKVSTGAQTGTGNGVWQWIDVTDTALAAGRYYLAHSRDNITANRALRYSQGQLLSVLQMSGAQDSTTDAYPLPDPLTNMALASVVQSLYEVGICLGAAT
jgi:hypothetical protein